MIKKTIILKKIILILIGIFSLMPFNGFAFFPVIDPTAVYNLGLQLRKLKDQYNLMKQQYDNSQSRLSEIQKVRGNSEGNYGFGNLLDGQEYKAKREWSPDNWQDALKGLSGGNPERYKELVDQYNSANKKTLSESDFDKGESAENGEIYQAQIQSNRTASVTATYAFNDIKNHIEHIEAISQKIESAPNQKAATDLNTRMNAEIAYTQVEVLKQLALMNEQTAERNSERIKYETANAKFNQLPDGVN